MHSVCDKGIEIGVRVLKKITLKLMVVNKIHAWWYIYLVTNFRNFWIAPHRYKIFFEK